MLWEQMDRIVAGQDVDNKVHHDLFLEKIDHVKAHLAMVFHRFMEGRSPLSILINSRHVEPWDPFLTHEKATQQLAEERIKLFGSEVNVVPYVLPHVSKLDRKTHERGAGARGWNAHQGFYVYRNKRLLVPGDWLGLPYTKDNTAAARIRIDIPNSMDQKWEMNVKKSKARPPDAFRPYLKGIADKTRKRASDIYRHRGKVIARDNAASYVFAWEKRVKHSKIFYSVNREHPLVKDIVLNSGVSRARIDALLRLLRRQYPSRGSMMNNAENCQNRPGGERKRTFRESPNLAGLRSDARSARRTLAKRLDHAGRDLSAGYDGAFERYPEAVEALPRKQATKEKTDNEQFRKSQTARDGDAQRQSHSDARRERSELPSPRICSTAGRPRRTARLQRRSSFVEMKPLVNVWIGTATEKHSKGRHRENHLGWLIVTAG